MALVKTVYLGGYQIIDFKGKLIPLSSETTDDPDIVNSFRYALKKKKPVYLSNFVTSDDVDEIGPIPLELRGTNFICNRFDTNGGHSGAYIFDLSDIEDTGEVSYYYFKE